MGAKRLQGTNISLTGTRGGLQGAAVGSPFHSFMLQIYSDAPNLFSQQLCEVVTLTVHDPQATSGPFFPPPSLALQPLHHIASQFKPVCSWGGRSDPFIVGSVSCSSAHSGHVGKLCGY